MVDLDRAEPQPLEPRRRARLADEPRQVEPRVAVAEAAEVDPREHHLAMALLDATTNLGEDGLRAAAARGAAHERDHAEVAAEGTAVLDLDERAHAVDPGVGLHAPDRADVARHECGGCLAALRDDGHVLGQARECVARQVGAATGDVDAPMAARGPCGGLAALGERLVRDAARADHGDVRARAVQLVVAVPKQRLADLVHVGMRDLAAEEVDAERRHAGDRTEVTSSRSCGARRRPSRRSPGAPRACNRGAVAPPTSGSPR